MATTAESPRQQFPYPLLARIALSVVRGHPRSVGQDAEGGLKGAHPSPVAHGTHHIPPQGAFVVVGNHYDRPGLWAGWGAMVVSAAVRRTGAAPRDIHWLMVAELLDFRLGRLRVPRAWLRSVFVRFARVYGFGLVTPRETGLVGGAIGLRAAARYLADGEPVGILPEGTASVALQEARPGVGAAIEWLTRGGVPIVPVGIAERDGVLEARFGAPFALPAVRGDRATRDRLLRDAVMGEIAALLPAGLRGYYAAPPSSGEAGPSSLPGDG